MSFISFHYYSNYFTNDIFVFAFEVMCWSWFFQRRRRSRPSGNEIPTEEEIVPESPIETYALANTSKFLISRRTCSLVIVNETTQHQCIVIIIVSIIFPGIECYNVCNIFSNHFVHFCGHMFMYIFKHIYMYFYQPHLHFDCQFGQLAYCNSASSLFTSSNLGTKPHQSHVSL